MTPLELRLYIKGQRMAEELRQELRERNLYTLAALIRSAVWGKKMPSFEDAFGGSDDMDDEAMYRTVRALNAALGGRE